MSPNHCVRLLEHHQAWRRFDGDMCDGPTMLPPKVIGDAIDAAIDIANQCEDILDMLCLALPYVENAITDPAYKSEKVAALAKRIETMIRRRDQFGEAAEMVNDTSAPAIVFFPCGSLVEAVEEGGAA